MWYKQKNIAYFTLLISFVSYVIFAYFLQRNQFIALIFLYGICLLAFYILVKNDTINDRVLFYAGILLRLIFLFSLPNLSQDFYRFIWDGRLLTSGINPYLYTPDELIKNTIPVIPQAAELYQGMGALSASHYTNYPPVNQGCFAVASLLAGKSIIGSVIVFKFLIILADLGVYYFGKKLLQLLRLPTNKIFYYFLNPLVIIELAGNLHFEGVMIFFLVWSFYLLQSGKWQWAALAFAVSISIKLIPLMLLPMVWRYLGLKKTIGFYSIVGVVTVGLFTPFLSKEFINKFIETVALWFINFEFNASIYYLVREIGYSIKGYNTIHTIGKIIPIVMVLSIATLSCLRKNTQFKGMISTMLLALSIYFFLSTTVHPWYIVTLVALTVFTSYQFPLYWSALIMLSYFAYANEGFKESTILLAVEYILVISLFFTEVFKLQINLFRSKNSI
jgi:alpha-1,6-mannosyltransferase